MPAAAVQATRFTAIYAGRADQVAQARHDVARHLTARGFPRVDDAIMVLGEFAANSVTHSDSRGQFFTVRCELFPTYAWVEVEDLGGEWRSRLPDEDRPHGLEIVTALVGDAWGVEGDERGWIAWSRLAS